MPEESGASLLLIGGQVFGIAFIFVLGYLIPLQPTYDTIFTPASIFIFSVMCVAMLAVLGFDSQYKRLAHESGLHT